MLKDNGRKRKNKSCKCKACKARFDIVQSEIYNINDVKIITCPKCGSENRL